MAGAIPPPEQKGIQPEKKIEQQAPKSPIEIISPNDSSFDHKVNATALHTMQPRLPSLGSGGQQIQMSRAFPGEVSDKHLAAAQNFNIELFLEKFMGEEKDHKILIFDQDPTNNQVEVADLSAAQGLGAEKLKELLTGQNLGFANDQQVVCPQGRETVLENAEFIPHALCSDEIKEEMQKQPFVVDKTKIFVVDDDNWDDLVDALETKMEENLAPQAPPTEAKEAKKKEKKEKAEKTEKRPFLERRFAHTPIAESSPTEVNSTKIALIEFQVSSQLFEIYRDFEESMQEAREEMKTEIKAEKEQQVIKRDELRFSQRREKVKVEMAKRDESIRATPEIQLKGEPSTPINRS